MVFMLIYIIVNFKMLVADRGQMLLSATHFIFASVLKLETTLASYGALHQGS